MRMMPTEFLKIRDKHGTMTRSKRKSTSHVAHVSVPLKGLSRFAQLNEADPLLASILTNWVVLQDRISLRPGYGQVGAIADGRVISTMIPFYGVGQKFIVAAGDGLFNATGTRIGSHVYGGDQWQWTSFANLSQKKYTAMLNGYDGVWLWDGTSGSLPSAHADAIDIPEADPSGFRQIATHLPDINPQTGEPSAKASPNFDAHKLDKILSHANRVWVADSIDLNVYYYDLQTIETTGALGTLPLNAYFRRGGTIKSLQTWTLDGGAGMNSMLVIFTSNGEAAIYSGTDPAVEISASTVSTVRWLPAPPSITAASCTC